MKNVAGSAFLLASIASVTVGACGSDSDSGAPVGVNTNKAKIDSQAFCDLYITECKAEAISVADCVKAFGVVRVSDACKSLVDTATCATIAAQFAGTCFPACTGTTKTCNSDGTITACLNGHTDVADCNAVCMAKGALYSGTCGTSFNGQASSDGEPNCFCR